MSAAKLANAYIDADDYDQAYDRRLVLVFEGRDGRAKTSWLYEVGFSDNVMESCKGDPSSIVQRLRKIIDQIEEDHLK